MPNQLSKRRERMAEEIADVEEGDGMLIEYQPIGRTAASFVSHRGHVDEIRGSDGVFRVIIETDNRRIGVSVHMTPDGPMLVDRITREDRDDVEATDVERWFGVLTGAIAPAPNTGDGR